MSFLIQASKRTRPRLLTSFYPSLLALLLIVFIGGAAHAKTPSTLTPAQKGRILSAYGRLPLSFEQNTGQTDKQVKFLSKGPGYSLFLTPTQAVMTLQKEADKKASVLRMTLKGANPAPSIAGQNKLPGQMNYLIGSDKSKWHTHIATYGQVGYKNVYPGVDLRYYGNNRQLEYDFIVNPGAKPDAIKLGFAGAKSVSLTKAGGLTLSAAGGSVSWHAPVVYQTVNGKRQSVPGRFVVANNTARFAVGRYDHSKPLVIDPALEYSTYLGGSNYDLAYGVFVDQYRQAYVTGYTNSTEFPASTSLNTQGNLNVFVTKFNTTGTNVIFSTIIGGNNTSYGYGVAVDSGGYANVVGFTYASDFPVTDGSIYGGGGDAFVAQLLTDGSGLYYGKYMPNFSGMSTASGYDSAYAVTIDGSDNIYVVDYVYYASSYPGLTVIAEFNDNGALQTDNYIYGTSGGQTQGNGIALDSSGNVYVTGQTTDASLYNRNNSYHGGGSDAFAVKLNSSLGTIYQTYLGGTSYDYGNAIAADSSGNAYVGGETYSSDFPQTTGPGFVSSSDGFVTKISADGTAIAYSRLLPGDSYYNAVCGIAVDGSGQAYAAGYVYHATTGFDAFVSQFSSDGSSLLSNTAFNGLDTDQAFGLTRDSTGNAYVVGYTSSTSDYFPTTPGTYNRFGFVGDGNYDAFVAKVDYTYPAPSINNISPTTAFTGSSGFTLIVTGQGFVNGVSVVYFGGTPLTTTYVSPSELDAQVPASLLTTAGTRTVTVRNPAPGGGTSNGVSFSVVGTISLSVSPNFVYQGAPSFGKVTLPSSAGSGGVVVTLSSSDPATANVPSNVTIPAGKTSATFQISTASKVPADTTVTLTASGAGSTASTTLVVATKYSVKGAIKNTDGTPLSGVKVTAAGTSTFTLTQYTTASSTIPASGTVSIPLAVTEPGTVIDLRVGVSIAHPHVNQLKITLVGPDGTSVLLKDTGTGGANLLTDYPVLDTPTQSLSAFNGKPVLGTWNLQIQNTGTSSGSVNLFDLNFTYQGTLTRTAVTKSDGTFDVGGLKAATYTVTPSLSGYSFSPASLSATVGPTVTGLNFTAGQDPTLTSVSPSSAYAGNGNTTITLTGTDFASGAIAYFNGTALTTTFVSSTQLTAVIPASLLSATGTASITVANPAPGGTSGAVSFLVQPRLKSLSLSASSVVSGTNVTGTVTLTGAAPISGTTITLSSSNTGAVTVPSSVTVPGGGTSATFTITTNAVSGSTGTTITASGPGATKTATLTVKPSQVASLSLSSASVVSGTPVTATVTLSSPAPAGGTVVTLSTSNSGVATVPASITVAAGATTASFTVTTKSVTANTNVTIGAAAGGMTATQTLTVTPAPPIITSLSPASATAGGPAFTLTVNGTGFLAGSIVKWNGATQTTTFVSSTKLTASIPASLIATAGTAQVTVTTPHVGTSALVNFTINPKPPTITGLSPSSKKKGSGTFTLTVSGTNFVSNSVVKWNGGTLTTTYVSATKLTATVPASLLTATGTEQITVTTPHVGTSPVVNFTVTN